MSTKKITDLTAVTSVLANTLLVVVDSSGPTTSKITLANFVNNIPSNTTFAANVSSQGTLTANVLTATDNVSFNTTKYVTANNIMIKKTTTPANTNDVLSASTVGLIWSDGSYIYVQANSTTVKRAAIATW